MKKAEVIRRQAELLIECDFLAQKFTQNVRKRKKNIKYRNSTSYEKNKLY